MIKLWPTTPMDQLTPRASSLSGHRERNPFDLPPPSAANTAPKSQLSHPLLTPTRLPSSYSPFIPGSAYAAADAHTPLASPTVGTFAAALPTTHLSIHAPDFNMALPSSKLNKSVPNRSSASQAPSASSSLSIPSTSNSSASTSISNGSSSPSSQPSASKGQIHVKLIQARGLNVRASSARPYVVVQFEQNEFVSRDPTDESDKEVKGTASALSSNIPRTSSSNAISALGAIGSKAAAIDAAHRKGKRSIDSKDTSPASSVGSGKSSGSNGMMNGLFGGARPPHSPVWKHEVSL